MIRKHKIFSRPKKAFDTNRIKAEDVLVEKYGLKNKREIWKAKAKLDSIRRRAKKLINESQDVQEAFILKLEKQGYKVNNVVEVLALNEENVLNRRLQTIVLKKELATTPKGARQLITHKHISINGKVVNIPSYHVEVNQEDKIKKILIKSIAKPKKSVEDVENENLEEEIMEVAA